MRIRVGALALIALGCAEKAPDYEPTGGGAAPVPDAAVAAPGCLDRDRDGYGEGLDCRGPDCDDSDARVNPGATEVCDGQDEDCDGAVDDNLDAPECGLTRGVCAGGRQRCVAGAWAPCAGPDSYGPAYEPDEASCDGLDNDCDGRIDDECPCELGDTQPCGLEMGECRAGLQACVGGRYGPCEGTVGPAVEICNGRDDDCDGDTDEGLDATRPDCPLQAGVCAGARATCGGVECWQACGAKAYGETWRGEEGDDDCDRLDNDCDGRVDEACDCDEGATQVCGVDVGRCVPGEQVCVGGRFSACNGAVAPRDEICDGGDDDCDGQVDEQLVAPACPLNSGVCAGSTQLCARGWVPCDAERYAAHDARFVPDETDAQCDGLDNDCDGLVDEPCDCADGAMQVCGDNVGRCTQGQQVCVGGRFGACSGAGPTDETCDGTDEDCDGRADEGVEGPACPRQIGVCTGSRQTCREGALTECGADEYGADWEDVESSCDGEDNDCDGETDEGCECVDGRVQPCGTDVGACTRGTQTCVAGAWSACEGAVDPGVERCNAEDDDCDERTDEDLVGPACALEVGVCAGATQPCGPTGEFTACDAVVYGPRHVAAETDAHCDGLDNDCDGETDEACECRPGGPRPVCGSDLGACQSGRLVCADGRFGECEGAIGPEAEVCNAIDDDCDDRTDESLQASACPLQDGVCAGAVQRCGGQAGWLECAPEDYGAFYRAEERAADCDGRDNDCDGAFDEACDPPPVVISELYFNGPGNDGPHEFIELAGPPGAYLGGLVLEAINGGDGEVYATIPVTGRQMPFHGEYLIVESGTPARPGAGGVLLDIAAQVARGADLQNGPDSLRLRWNGRTIDAVAYGAFPDPAFAAGEGAPAPQVDEESLTRDADNRDTDDNATDFVPSSRSALGVPTPGGEPLPRLHVALRWDVDGLDMDLHVMRPGARFASTPGDCYYGNRTPAWAADGTLGDPRLDRDDVDGLGPEFFDYVRPLPGRYLVVVHSFGAERGGPSTATVGLFVEGAEPVTLTRRIDRDARYWAVAEVEVAADGALAVRPRDEVSAQPVSNE